MLADTSVRVDHLRHGNAWLANLLSNGLVLIHSFVSGELACCNLSQRAAILSHLEALPQAKPALHAEVLHLVELRRLWGRGLGWVDAHLIASALLSECRFWALDVKLAKASADLGLGCPLASSTTVL